jgi:COMPASS component SWD3
MSGTESPDPLAGEAVPPSKRRRLHDESDVSTPQPEVKRTRDDAPDTPDERRLSVRPGRPRSLSRSRSRDGRKEKFYGGESDRSTERSRSRSRSRSRRRRTRSFSGSQSRSRTRSRSDSRSRTRTRSRGSSRTRSRSNSRSQYHTPARDRTSTPNTPPAVAPSKPDYRPRLLLRGHTGPVSQVLISPNGSYIASSSADGTARIWDAATGSHLNTLVGHMAGVNCVAWSPDSMTLATGSDDKSIRLWDRITGGPAHDVPTAGRGAFDGDGTEGVNGRGVSRRNRRAQLAYAQNAAAAAQTGGDVDDRKPPIRGTKRALLGHSNYVTCLAFSPKGNLLASGSYDEAVFLWDVRAGVELGREAKDSSRLPAHSDPVSGVDFCADGTLVASCSTDGLMCASFTCFSLPTVIC